MAVQRLAMIGARGHYNYALRALPELPAVRLVGVADGAADDPARPILDWASQHGHQPQVFSDYLQMLDATRPDAVVVCGPFERHAEMTIQAIQRGIHVFVEKPAALTFEELEQLRAVLARNPQVHLAGMMGIRYDPGFYTAWKLIRSGAIGDVRMLNARKSYKLGRRPSYYHDRRSYGGTIPWVGSHAIDWVLWFSGHKVERIYAQHSSQANEGHGTMERAAVCELGLSDGRFASISIDLFRPAKAPSHGDDWIRVVGTRGVIEARNQSVSLINDDNDGTQAVPVTSDRQVFRDFVEHIDGRRPGLIDARQTLVLTEVCLLARQSADEGGKVIEISGQRELRFLQE